MLTRAIFPRQRRPGEKSAPPLATDAGPHNNVRARPVSYPVPAGDAHMSRARIVFAAVLAAGFAAAAAADDSKLKVKVGDKFPNIPLEAAQIEKVKKDGKELSIADLKG